MYSRNKFRELAFEHRYGKVYNRSLPIWYRRDRLQSEHRLASVNYYRKESFSRFADPALIAQIRAENDVVFSAIGD